MKPDSTSPEFRAKVAELWADQTKSMKMIAEELGVTKNVIAGLRYRMALPMRKNATTFQEKVEKKPRVRNKNPVPRVTKPVEVKKPKEPVYVPPPPALVYARPHSTGYCRWPMWGKGKPTHEYCGKPTVGSGTLGKLYCVAHAVMAKRKDAA